MRQVFFWQALGAIVLGALLAKWTWILFAPHKVAAIAAPGQYAAADAEKLFGASAAPGVKASALPNVHLAGVFDGSPGFAILVLDGSKQIGVPLGGEIVQGVKLLEIAADHVVIGSGDMRQRVDLDNVASGNRLAEMMLNNGANNAPALPEARRPAPAPDAATIKKLKAMQQEMLHRKIRGGTAH